MKQVVPSLCAYFSNSCCCHPLIFSLVHHLNPKFLVSFFIHRSLFAVFPLFSPLYTRFRNLLSIPAIPNAHNMAIYHFKMPCSTLSLGPKRTPNHQAYSLISYSIILVTPHRSQAKHFTLCSFHGVCCKCLTYHFQI